jgi:hypothetical protein
MISGKLTFQCTEHGLQNPLYCPGSIQDTFIIYFPISHQHIFQNYVVKQTKKTRIRNISQNHKSQSFAICQCQDSILHDSNRPQEDNGPNRHNSPPGQGGSLGSATGEMLDLNLGRRLGAPNLISMVLHQK